MPVPDILGYTELAPWLLVAIPDQARRLGVNLSTIASWVGLTVGHLVNLRKGVRPLQALYVIVLGLALGLDPPRLRYLHLLWRKAQAPPDLDAIEAALAHLRATTPTDPPLPRGRPRKRKVLPPPAPPLAAICPALRPHEDALRDWLPAATQVLASHPTPELVARQGVFWPEPSPHQRPAVAAPAATVLLDGAEPAHRPALRQGLGLARLGRFRLPGSEQVNQFTLGALPQHAVPHFLARAREALLALLAEVPPLTADQPHARQVCLALQILALHPPLPPDAAPPDHAALWAALGAPRPEPPARPRRPDPQRLPDLVQAPDVRTWLMQVDQHLRRKPGARPYGPIARRTTISASHVRNLLTGERNLTLEYVPDLAKGLRLSATDTEHLHLRVALERSENPAERVDLTRQLLLNPHFRATRPALAAFYGAMGSAIHQTVLAMSSMASFRADPTWLGGALGVDPTRCRQALHDLIRHGFLICGPDARLRPSQGFVGGELVTSEPVAIQTADQMLMAAQASADTDATLLHLQAHLWVPERWYRLFLQRVVRIQRTLDADAADYGLDPQADLALSWLVQAIPVTQPWWEQPAPVLEDDTG